MVNRTVFYKEDARRWSRELDFGVWWRTARHDSKNYRLSWLADTGEVVKVSLNGNENYEVVAIIETEAEVERRLAGWADICGTKGSLDWALERLAP